MPPRPYPGSVVRGIDQTQENCMVSALTFKTDQNLRIKLKLAVQDPVAGLKPGPGETGVPPLQKLEAKTSLS